MSVVTTAIVQRSLGGPEVLKIEEVPLPAPGEGEVQIRQAAIGLNFIDVYFRTGLYKAANGLPFVPGKEGAGTVTAVGPGVEDFAVGDRVALGISHPCTTFDKWRWMPVVDDAWTIVDAVETRF